MKHRSKITKITKNKYLQNCSNNFYRIYSDRLFHKKILNTAVLVALCSVTAVSFSPKVFAVSQSKQVAVASPSSSAPLGIGKLSKDQNNSAAPLLPGADLMVNPPGISTKQIGFFIKKIELEGLVHLSYSSVMTNVSLKPGDSLTIANSNQLISTLYQTGYFSDIQLFTANPGVLIIKVTERPTIGAIKITGNSLIKTQQIKDVLLKIGIQSGDMLDQSTLLKLKQSLEQQYQTLGKYPAIVTTDTAPMSNNRVEVKINISEGLYTKVARINFVGNHNFDQSELEDNFKLSTPSLWTLFNSDDEFTEANLTSSLQQLTDFYQDNGFLKFQINSSQASLTSTKKQALLTVNLTEGALYHFEGVSLSGDFVLPKEKLQQLVSIHTGDVFSKAAVMNTAQAMQLAMADQGYAFAVVNPIPTVDEHKKSIAINFFINPGKRVYIHQVRFEGNTEANDKTLRLRMGFPEGSLYNQTKINQSKLKLQQLPFIQAVTEQAVPVPGSTDEVDIIFNITERNANKVGASIGYSELDKFIIGGNLTMPDVFGTGNIFSIDMQLSQPYQSLNFTFTQPYFTDSGISQSVNLYVSKLDNAHTSLISYSMDQIGAGLNYGVPLSAFNTFTFGSGVDHSHLLNPYGSTSLTVQQFTREWGNNFNDLTLNLGWTHDSTNNSYFPSTGSQGGLGGTVTAPINKINWYKTYVNGAWFHPIIWNRFVFGVRGEVDYGDGYGRMDNLPFYENYYGGGWGSVRGYEQGSLGPDDTIDCGSGVTGCTARGESLGGNLKLDASVNFYFPVPFATAQQNIRMGVFGDMGNVYDTYHLSTAYNTNANPTHPNFENLRYSVGVEFQWLSPIGALGFSLAAPLNKKPGDDTNIFQFNLGQTF